MNTSRGVEPTKVTITRYSMIKWPLVTRAYHDATVELANDRVAFMKEMYVSECAHTKYLMTAILGMKKEGFVAAPDYSAPIDQPLTVDEQDELRAQESGG